MVTDGPPCHHWKEPCPCSAHTSKQGDKKPDMKALDLGLGFKAQLCSLGFSIPSEFVTKSILQVWVPTQYQEHDALPLPPSESQGCKHDSLQCHSTCQGTLCMLAPPSTLQRHQVHHPPLPLLQHKQHCRIKLVVMTVWRVSSSQKQTQKVLLKAMQCRTNNHARWKTWVLMKVFRESR
jgi:hypothetical protein